MFINLQAKKWKEPKCPSANEQINKMLSLYTMKYSVTVRN